MYGWVRRAPRWVVWTAAATAVAIVVLSVLVVQVVRRATGTSTPNVDTQPPSAPGRPSCSAIGSTTITLAWGASTDDVGVVGYDIYHDGTHIDSTSETVTSKDLINLNANVEYRLSVVGRDAAGNASDTSDVTRCRTRRLDDPNPPTTPGNLTHSNVSQNTVDLTWEPATDDRGLTAYLVRDRANAVLDTVTGNPPATSAKVSGLACNSAYTVHVVARDAAGNLSRPSNTRSFTTRGCNRGVPQNPTTVSTGWSIPWDICWVPGRQEALVTERDNFQVSRLTLGGTKNPVGSVPNVATTGSEGGLMGCAVSPTWNGSSDQAVFFMHTSPSDNRIVRMNYNGNSLSDSSTAIVTGIRRNAIHNGGRLRFGPDGLLYASTGDAAQSNLAQNRDSPNGKILRFTRTGKAAPGNPFGTLVYSYGHRNPQGLAWDSAGRLWESEFGNSEWDEINLILPGRNYGWPTCEGSCGVSGMENPKWQQRPSDCSCSGMDIVGNTIYLGALRGKRLWRVELNGTNAGAASSYFVGTFGRIRAVTKVPGANAIWFGTTNADNNGGQPDGSDVVRRSNIR